MIFLFVLFVVALLLAMWAISKYYEGLAITFCVISTLAGFAMILLGQYIS